jgi:hypothetical protein
LQVIGRQALVIAVVNPLVGRHPAVVVRLSAVGLQTDGAFVAQQRGVELTQCAQRPAAIVVCIGVSRIEAQSELIVSQSFAPAPEVAQDVAGVVARDRVVRTRRDDPLQQVCRLVEVIRLRLDLLARIGSGSRLEGLRQRN